MKFDFTKNLKSGLFWIGLFKTAGQVFIWTNTIIIARFLDPADYGLVGMANLITSFILLIGNFGFGTSLVQKKDLQAIHVHSLFWITAAIGLFSSIVLYFGAPLSASFFENPEVVPILRLSLVALFFNIISDIPAKLLLKNLRYKSSGLTDFASNFIASVSVLILAIKGYGAYSLIVGSIISGVLKFLLACFLEKWYPKFQFQRKGLKGFLTFGGAIVINRILWYAYANSDYVILAKRLGQVSFGLYSFAFNLACMPASKLRPIIYPVLYSSFSQLQDDLPQLREQYLKIVNFSFSFYAMIYCGIFWVCPEFVEIFLGSKWLPIIPVLQILLVVQPLRSISSLSSSVTDALGRPDVGALNMLIFVVIMVPSFAIASYWGMIGVALAWCFIYPIAFIIVMRRALHVSEISLSHYTAQLVSGLKFILFTSVAIFLYKTLLSHLYSTHDIAYVWVSLLGTIFVGTLSNLCVLWFFEKRYINMILSLVKK